jgi:hypothetical protein
MSDQDIAAIAARRHTAGSSRRRRTTMPPLHRGSCHCGRVAFELHAAIDHVVDCNCSICRRRGALWVGASDAQLRIVSGEDALTLYRFGTGTAKHYFCRHCGIHPFVRPRIAPTMWAVNARCIDGLDLAALPVQPFDGVHWEEAAQMFYAQRKP